MSVPFLPYNNTGIPHIVSTITNTHTLSCGDGYSVQYDSDTTNVRCLPNGQNASGFTSHVYEFKSRKGRNVEDFSQNTNGKCKARY